MAIVYSINGFFSVVVKWFPYPGHLALDVCEPTGKIRMLRMPLIPFNRLPESCKEILKEDTPNVTLKKDIEETRKFWLQEQSRILIERED